MAWSVAMIGEPRELTPSKHFQKYDYTATPTP